MTIRWNVWDRRLLVLCFALWPHDWKSLCLYSERNCSQFALHTIASRYSDEFCIWHLKIARNYCTGNVSQMTSFSILFAKRVCWARWNSILTTECHTINCATETCSISMEYENDAVSSRHFELARWSIQLFQYARMPIIRLISNIQTNATIIDRFTCGLRSITGQIWNGVFFIKSNPADKSRFICTTCVVFNIFSVNSLLGVDILMRPPQSNSNSKRNSNKTSELWEGKHFTRRPSLTWDANALSIHSC